MLAFVHIYKTAGTTLKFLLRRNFGSRHFDTGLLRDSTNLSAALLRRIKWLYPRLISIAGHEVRSFSDLRRECPDIRFYTFLREPKARAISAFRTKAANRIAHDGWQPGSTADIEPSFVEFVHAQRHFMCRAFVRDAGAAEAIEALERDIGFVGFVEHFDESLTALRQWVGRPDFDVRYRRQNLGANRAAAQQRFRPFAAAIARMDEAVFELAARPHLSAMLDEIAAPDRLLFEHALARRFAADQSAGDMPEMTTYEDPELPREALSGRLHRFFVARPLVPLLARSAAPFATAE